MAKRIGRILAIAAGLALASIAALSLALPRIAGTPAGPPQALSAALSPAARDLIDAAYDGIDATRLFDHHVHVVGLGRGGTGAWVSPHLQSWLSPMRRLRFSVYAHAAGIDDLEQADGQYVARLTALIEALPRRGRAALLAFDHHYEPSGERDLEHSELYMPNERVLALAAARPDLFEPVISVHPYRRDALDELRKGAAAGARVVKWLPNAMGIDPSLPALDPFYAEMKRLGLALLTHAGEEKAVEAEEDQRLGNPLLLRRPLDRGVPVIVAHCGSLGMGEDLDDPAKPQVPNLDLFLRLMDDPAYRGRLFGEISSTTFFNRVDGVLATLLRRTDLHARLVNGSDYPLPAINVIVRTSKLVEFGYITADQANALNEIYAYNPLLFDFVVKRTVRAPKTGERFADEVFLRRELYSAQ